MKKLITLFFAIIFIGTASAQTPQLTWAKSFKGKGASTDSSSVIKMYHQDHSIYILGTSDAFGTANDIVLMKRDYTTGDTLWIRHYNGPASGDDQAVDLVVNQKTGEVYLTGKCSGLGSGYDVITLKYTAAGELKWVQRWDNPNYHGDDIPKSIGIDFNGKVYVTGSSYNGTNGDANLDDMFIHRYETNGILNYDLTNIYTTMYWPIKRSKDLVGASRVNNAGDVFIAGDFLMGDLNNGWSAIYLYALSSNFMEYYTQSCTRLYPKNTAFPQGVTVSSPDDFNNYQAMDLDNSNNVYLAYLNDTVAQQGNGYRICIAKINSSGCTIWEKSFGKQSRENNLGVKSIKVDAVGNVYAVGFEKNSSGNFDWFVIKYNSTGVFQWRVNKKGTGNGNDMAHEIAFDNLQNPLVVGVTNNTGTNNDITFVKYNKSNGAEWYAVNYDSNNGDEKGYNVMVDAGQNIIINGIVNTTTQSQNMITLRYCNPPETPAISSNGTTLHSDAPFGNQWYNENGIISGAISQDYTPTSVGDYYVIVSLDGCSSDASNTLHFIPAVNCTAPAAPARCIASIGDPANGLEHFTKVTCDPVSDADGYAYEYSWDGSDWQINWYLTPSAVIGVNHDDSPNTAIYYRVRAYKCSPLQYSSYTYAPPVYTACDVPAPLTIHAVTSNSLDITLNPETPKENPWYTRYCIYYFTPNTAGYVQADGTLGELPFYQPKEAWGTIHVTGLSAIGEYCFYAFALNNDDDIAYNEGYPDCAILTDIAAPQLSPLNNALGFKIFPNPVTHELTIEKAGNTHPIDIELNNSLGQVIFTGSVLEKTVVPMTNFSPGVYFIKLKSGTTFECKKVIKN